MFRRNLSTLLVCFTLTAPIARSEPLPNIVIFLADDFGVGSVNVNGADDNLVRTPNINRLAEEGMNFTNAYTTGSVCSPTRYALLTGRYSWRTSMKSGVINPNDKLLIDRDTLTIGGYLQARGYQTAHVGKWHLGYGAQKSENLLGALTPGPNDVGFDYHFGVPNNQDDLSKIYVENEGIYGLRSNRMSPYGKSFYGKPYAGYDAPQRVTTQVMDTLTSKAVEWIGKADRQEPFFLYFASTAVHHPISPSERMRGTSEAGAYGDFIHDTDYSVGQIMRALEAKGIADNTIFVFAGDNGGDIPSDKRRPEAQALNRGLTLNGAFRGDKHTIYNGGFRVPYILHWPRGIAGGESRSGLVSTVDLFSTIAELIGGERPAAEDGAPDSFSFKSLFKEGAPMPGRPHLVLRDAKGRKAILFGPWKYVSSELPGKKQGKGQRKLAEELYHLPSDPSETKDVATKNPKILTQGRELLKSIVEMPD